MLSEDGSFTTLSYEGGGECTRLSFATFMSPALIKASAHVPGVGAGAGLSRESEETRSPKFSVSASAPICPPQDLSANVAGAALDDRAIADTHTLTSNYMTSSGV